MFAATVWAEGKNAPDAAASADELPLLPAAPKLELGQPSPKDLEDLDARLAGLTSKVEAERDDAARALLEVDARLLPALAFRLDNVADRAEKEAMKRLFGLIRQDSKELARGDDADGARTGSASPDYLDMLVRSRHADDKAYKDLISVVGMSRMLSQIGTVEAVRVLISVYVRFGEFLRVHTQREFARLGDKAVPALLEARRHPAEKIARWASRQLDALGRAVPGEAVRINDPQVLADVLRAYGRTRDPDATRIVVSFANSERGVVREAARQAIGLFGETCMWQLKDTYESTVGKKPPRDWSWERSARELFAAFDRARSASVERAFEAGRAARKKGDLEAMRRAFDQVIAENPRFEKRAELKAGYQAYAAQVFDRDPEAAGIALGRATRLSDDAAEQKRLQSELFTLRAIQSVKAGLFDRVLVERALELDPDNPRARLLRDKLRHPEAGSSTEHARKLAAGGIAVAALAAVLALLRKRREDDIDAQPPERKAEDVVEAQPPEPKTEDVVEAQPPEPKTEDVVETQPPERKGTD
jgi:hypothetical protein